MNHLWCMTYKTKILKQVVESSHSAKPASKAKKAGTNTTLQKSNNRLETVILIMRLSEQAVQKRANRCRNKSRAQI